MSKKLKTYELKLKDGTILEVEAKTRSQARKKSHQYGVNPGRVEQVRELGPALVAA